MISSHLMASRGEIATRATPNPRHAELVSAFMAQSPRHGQPFARSRKAGHYPTVSRRRDCHLPVKGRF